MANPFHCRNSACPQRHCPLCERERTHTDGSTVLYRRHVEDNDNVCVHCLGAARRWLRALPTHEAAIRKGLDGYAAHSPGISERTSRDADTPLLGGDRTALIGPGNAPDSHNSEHPDNLETDPPSVVAHLMSWERDWRRKLHIGGAQDEPTLDNVVKFLLSTLTWASRNHPDYEPFHHELRRLHAHMEQAASHADRPERDVAECLDCPTVNLYRGWTENGLDDKWTCPKCRRRYDEDTYGLARWETHKRVRARAEAQKAQEDTVALAEAIGRQEEQTG